MSDNPGSILKDARQSREITVQQAAESIHIRQRYIEALEEDRLDIFSSGQQMRGFLRSYAAYLGLDVGEVLDAFRAYYTSGEVAPEPAAQHDDEIIQESEGDEVDAIFAEIGEKLLTQREMLGLRLEEVERQTHIKARYIQHLENGDFKRFPSPVQARGMLGNYAKFLDLDINALLLRYAEAVQAEFAASQPVNDEMEVQPEIRPRRIPLWLRNLFSPDLVVVSVLFVALIVFVVWGIRRISATQAADIPAPTAPSLVDVLIFPETATPTLTPEPELIDIDVGAELTREAGLEGEEGIPEIVIGANSAVNITLVVRQRAYLRVTVDGEVAFDGRVLPGETLNFSAEIQIELLTGNAAALHIFYNERDMGLLGVFGEVVNVIYTEQGATLPTPTTVPTATTTPAATAVPTSTPIVQEEQP